MLSKVDVSNSPSIEFAIGLCISFPGKSPPIASGINASIAVSAVMSIGLNLSLDPCMMVS